MNIRTKHQPFASPRRVFLQVLIMAAAVMALLLPSIAHSQTRPSVPDQNTLARLIWSTMVTLDNANRTENYTVIYNLGSPAFQARNTPQTLAANFQDLRNNRVDVGRAIMTTPTYYLGPHVDQYDRLRLRGGFDYRPKSIRFDLMYELVDGGWAINAISVVEMDSNAPK